MSETEFEAHVLVAGGVVVSDIKVNIPMQEELVTANYFSQTQG